MTTPIRRTSIRSLAAWATALLIPAAAGGQPASDVKPADMSKPVQVFILLGQSNMVGMGKLSGGSVRWGKEFTEPVVSVFLGGTAS